MSAAEGIYRRVSVRLWSDEKVRRLTPLQPSGQALWLYLMTGPQTGPIPGVFVAGRAALAEALDWEVEAFDACLAELVREGLVRFDRPARLWFIPNALRHNPPASPNVVRSWRSAWTLLPEGDMRDQIGAALLASLEGSSKACAEAFGEVIGKASAKASANQCPNQESGNRKQETGEEQKSLLDADAPAKVKEAPKPSAPKPSNESKTAETWQTYSKAYLHRYKVDPVRNAKVNGQLAQLVDRLGADDAPKVARYYVEHNGARYVGATHKVDLLLIDAEALRTQWATGRTAPESGAPGRARPGQDFGATKYTEDLGHESR